MGGGVWLGKRDDEISITIIRGQEPIDFPKEGEAERVKSLFQNMLNRQYFLECPLELEVNF